MHAFRLDTVRLEMRALTDADAPFILRLVNEPGWLRYIGDRGVRDEEAAKDYIVQGPVASYEKHGYGLWLVACREDRQPLGICGLVRRETLEGPDLGFAFLEAESGKGYATESGAAVLEYAAGALRLARVLAITSPDNEASQRVLAKLGFHEEAERVLEGESTPVSVFAWTASGGAR